MQRIASLGLGKLAVLCTLASVLCVLVAFGQNMFSAGPLSEQNRKQVARGGVNSHAEITSCSACHAPAWSSETMATRCLDCHENIRAQIDGAKAMHGLLAQGQDCMTCHTEHKGPHAALTSFAKFDHDCAAFKLIGKHKQADCASCHTDKVYQGAPQTCVSCHAEPTVHQGKFGTDCTHCHTPNTWHTTVFTAISSNNIKFNHDTTGFKLRDKHAGIDCKSCHVKESFKGLSQSCVACHKEPSSHKPHPKSFGVNCVQCHSTFAWKGATLVKHTFPMNHRTKNKKNSACAVCHPATINNNFTSPGPSTPSPSYASYTCYGCHHHTPEKEARRHANRKVANLNSCASCHLTGRGTKRRAAHEGASDLELCWGCPEASEGVQQLSGFFPASRPSAGAAYECAVGCKNPATLFLSLGQIPNMPPKGTLSAAGFVEFPEFGRVARPASTFDFAVPERSLWATHVALRVFDLRDLERGAKGHRRLFLALTAIE